MHLAYQYKLNPTDSQASILEHWSHQPWSKDRSLQTGVGIARH
jgi:hypothetical protein